VLAQHAMNVESLETFTSTAPMSGEMLFHAQAKLRATPALDQVALRRELEALSAELVVDIDLTEPT
jgi:glycine cleavage system regulatory protein